MVYNAFLGTRPENLKHLKVLRVTDLVCILLTKDYNSLDLMDFLGLLFPRYFKRRRGKQVSERKITESHPLLMVN